MIGDSCFADLIAHVKNGRHLLIGYHLNLSLVNARNSMDESEHVRHVVRLNVNATWRLVAVEHGQDHERFLLVQKIDGFFKELGNERSLLTEDAIKFPDLRV